MSSHHYSDHNAAALFKNLQATRVNSAGPLISSDTHSALRRLLREALSTVSTSSLTSNAVYSPDRFLRSPNHQALLQILPELQSFLEQQDNRNLEEEQIISNYLRGVLHLTTITRANQPQLIANNHSGFLTPAATGLPLQTIRDQLIDQDELDRLISLINISRLEHQLLPNENMAITAPLQPQGDRAAALRSNVATERLLHILDRDSHPTLRSLISSVWPPAPPRVCFQPTEGNVRTEATNSSTFSTTSNIVHTPCLAPTTDLTALEAWRATLRGQSPDLSPHFANRSAPWLTRPSTVLTSELPLFPFQPVESNAPQPEPNRATFAVASVTTDQAESFAHTTESAATSQTRDDPSIPSSQANQLTTNKKPAARATQPGVSEVGKTITKVFFASSFPHKLHRLLTKLQADNRTDVATFLDGGGVWVPDRRTFVEEILPTYFRSQGWASFRRQLYAYQFHAVTEPKKRKGAFENPFFLCGRPNLCHKITRNEKNVKKDRCCPARLPEV
ncbi:hypothetical protein ACA910_015523 [Epithemia clementina (nom. ined.)]